MRGAFPAGYKSTDADFDSIGEGGGAKTHSHSGVVASGTGGTASGAATHLPPYIALVFIERYK
jgi:hypothetical protein